MANVEDVISTEGRNLFPGELNASVLIFLQLKAHGDYGSILRLPNLISSLLGLSQ